LLFFFLGQAAQLGILGFNDQLMGAGQVLFDLLVFPVLGDNLLELRVLLGELLEARGVGDDFGRGELLSHFLVAGIELVELFGQGENSHG
jgi:hypothetical protein